MLCSMELPNPWLLPNSCGIAWYEDKKLRIPRWGTCIYDKLDRINCKTRQYKFLRYKGIRIPKSFSFCIKLRNCYMDKHSTRYCTLLSQPNRVRYYYMILVVQTNFKIWNASSPLALYQQFHFDSEVGNVKDVGKYNFTLTSPNERLNIS